MPPIFDPRSTLPRQADTVRRRLRAMALAALLAFAPGQALPVLVPMAAGLAATAAAAGPADARSSSSSGGYSRPSSSGGYTRPSSPSRTPSVSPYSSPQRTPSTSGGYSRPSFGTPAAPAPAAPSAGDRDISRQSSSDALRSYRAQQEAERNAARRPEPPPTGRFDGSRRYSTEDASRGSSGWGGWGGARPAAPAAGGWFANR